MSRPQIFLCEELFKLGDVFPGLAEAERPEVGVEWLIDEILHGDLTYLVYAEVHRVLEILWVMRVRDPIEMVCLN